MKPAFEERMKTLLPEEKDFEEFNKIVHTEPLDFIRCNTLKISPTDLLTKLRKKWEVDQPFPEHPEIMLIKGKLAETINGWAGQTPTRETHYKQGGSNTYDEASLGPGELGNALEHILGYYYVQEISSMLPPLALDPKPGEFVLDLFASPGSKTTQIAAKMENQGTIIANDLKIGRISILVSNLEKAGVTNTVVTRKDAIAFAAKLSGTDFKFDKILLDTPCSGEGTLRSSPKTFQMWNKKMIGKLSRQQKKFLAFAVKLLKVGGTLVYSTCTHAPEENEEIVDFALKNFPLKAETLNLPLKCREGVTSWQDKDYHKDTNKACRIYPHDNDSEGFFVSKFTLMEEVE